MIFAVIEQTKNGTVTISVHATLIEADTFEQAKEKLKSKLDYRLFTVMSDSTDILSCRSTQHGLSIVAELQNDPVNFIE